jgi:hypothetical protein
MTVNSSVHAGRLDGFVPDNGSYLGDRGRSWRALSVNALGCLLQLRLASGPGYCWVSVADFDFAAACMYAAAAWQATNDGRGRVLHLAMLSLSTRYADEYHFRIHDHVLMGSREKAGRWRNDAFWCGFLMIVTSTCMKAARLMHQCCSAIMGARARVSRTGCWRQRCTGSACG